MAKNMLLDKTFACLAGGAIGDVMGGYVEGWHYKGIQEKFGVLDNIDHSFRADRLYKYTDDTHLRNYIIEAIIKKGGRITAYDKAESWLEHFDRRYMDGSIIYNYLKLLRGVPPRETGHDEFPGVSATLGIAPIGIVNACDPKSAAEDAFDVASMMKGSYSREAPMAIAAAVAEAFKPEATLDSIIKASMAYCGTTVKEHIEKALSLAKKYDNGLKAIPEFYDKLLVSDGRDKVRHLFSSEELIERRGTDKFSISCDPLELVPVSLAFFYIEKGDPMKAMIAGANFGRDCDGIAGFAASIAGAFRGSAKIDMDMVEKVNKANNFNLMKQAEDMQPAIINTMRDKERSVQSIKKLLG